MAFSIFFSLSFIATLSFSLTKKNLNLFDVLFMWMVIIVIHHNIFTISAINLRMFDFTQIVSNYWALVIMRVFLIPVLIIWYFDFTSSPKPHKKWLWLPVGIVLLVGVEYLADSLHLYKVTRWKLWWYFVEWFAIFVAVNYTWLLYRKLFRKEIG